MDYPSPQDLGIRIPKNVKELEFCRGFEWALRGLQITSVEHLRQSFRFGFRAGKLYLNELRRARGIIPFPMKAHIRLSSIC